MGRNDESRAFLEAIRETPDDDTPRLIYADWLDDHGDATRAEFIRVQCELEKLPADDARFEAVRSRGGDLLWAHRAEWLGPLHKELNWGKCEFRRGFPEDITLRPKSIVKFAQDLEARVPAGRVLLYGSFGEPAMKELVACPHLDWLAGLRYEHPSLPEAGLEMLGEAATMPRLADLVVTFAPYTSKGIQALATSPHREALRSLCLHRFSMGDMEPPTTGDALADPAVLFRLRSLTLHGNALGEDGAARLASTPNLAEVKQLDLIVNHIRDDGAIALARSQYLRGLSMLVLQTNDLTSKSVIELADSPVIDGIHHLNLSVNRVEDAGAKALAASSRLANLRQLHLFGAQLTDRGVEILAGSPILSNLTHLDLMGNAITERGSQALFESPHLHRLEHLSLGPRSSQDAKLPARVRKQWRERLGKGARV